MKGQKMPNLPPPGSGVIEIADGSDLELGGDVSFLTDWPGKLKNPRIQVLAYQDVDIDGDGDIDPHSLTYGEAGGDDRVFTLGGSSSDWKRFGGGAQCHADLFYFLSGNHEWTGGGAQTGVVILASLDFTASG